MRHVAALLGTVMIVVGCSGPAKHDGAASPLATVATAPSSTASAAPTAVGTPGSTPVPTPDSTPVPAIAEKLKIAWKADDPVGLPGVASLVDAVHTDDGYVLVTDRYDSEGDRFEAWWSEDGRTWTLAQRFPEGQQIRALTAGGPGLVAGGSDGSDAVVWTSTDGRDWRTVADPSLRDGFIDRLVSTASGVVAFGSPLDGHAGRIWTSAD